MDKSKTGGKSILDSGSTVLPDLKPDGLSRLQQAKKSALESKRRLLDIDLPISPFVVRVNSAKLQGVARMLTEVEIEELQQTKLAIAKHASDVFKRAIGR